MIQTDLLVSSMAFSSEHLQAGKMKITFDQNSVNYFNNIFGNMCYILRYITKYSRTCLIRHTKGSGRCVGLYRMSEHSGFILVNRNTWWPYIFVGCHRMSENSGGGLYKFYCIQNRGCFTFILR